MLGKKQHVSVYSKILLQMLPQDPDRNNFKNTAIKLNGGFTWFIYLRIQKKTLTIPTEETASKIQINMNRADAPVYQIRSSAFSYPAPKLSLTILWKGNCWASELTG